MGKYRKMKKKRVRRSKKSLGRTVGKTVKEFLRGVKKGLKDYR